MRPMLAPRRANSLTVARPRPADAPVMTTTSRFMGSFQKCRSKTYMSPADMWLPIILERGETANSRLPGTEVLLSSRTVVERTHGISCLGSIGDGRAADRGGSRDGGERTAQSRLDAQYGGVDVCGLG